MTDDASNNRKNLPLAGVRVIDFTSLLPGPWATQMLGEMGADVIKVERPGIGDPSRHGLPRFRQESVYFNAVNGNKRSVTLDLSKEAGRGIARRLLGNADVAVESYRPGVARKLGIDFASAKIYNPRLIYCSMSGFGQTGPLSHIAGHDLLLQAMSGLMGAALDELNGPPPVPFFQAADYAVSVFAIIGIQAALAQRERTGEGCEIDLGMFESLFNMCMVPLTSALAQMAGFSGLPKMESFGGNPRYSTYMSKDGKPIAVTLLETKMWREFCTHIGRLDLVSDEESPADRLSAHGERSARYREALTEYCASYTWAEIMRHAEETGIAICPVCTPAEAVQLSQVKARGLITQINHPVEGRIPQLVNPLARAGLAQQTPLPAPALGEHTAEILNSLGYSKEEVSAFAKSGVV
jgi:alpha-methylacyl-CoA racemase